MSPSKDPRPLRFGLPDVARDVDEELGLHLDMLARQFEREGMSPADARRTAAERFGDAEAVREWLQSHDRRTHHATRRRELMSDLRHDIRVTLRQLWRSPGFALVTVLTLALGIGANTAVFSVVNGVLLRPLPFPRPRELVKIWLSNSAVKVERGYVSPVDVDDWRIQIAAEPGAVGQVGGYYFSESQSGTDLTGMGEPRRLASAFVTPGFFTTLGIHAQAGRLPRDEEMVRGADDKIVVISDAFWRSAFGGAPGAVGTRIMLSNVAYQIVGVMPAGVTFPSAHVEAYIPMSTISDEATPRRRNNRWIEVVGRLREGATLEQARTQFNAMTRRLAEVYPENGKWDQAAVLPLHGAIVGSVRTGLFVLLAAVMLVLLITCVNLASLVLARATARGREFAVRAALGAGRGRVIQQLLTESTVLALLGGTLGIGVAWLGTKLLVGLSAGQVPRVEGVRLDLPVLVFLAGVSIFTGLLFGLIPAIRISTPALHHALREGGRGATERRGQRMRGVLVVAQVAISVVLVVGAALMTQSFVRQMRVDLGFKPDHVVAVSFTISDSRIGPDGQLANHIRALLSQVRATPGVTAAGATKALPFRGNGEAATLTIQGAADTEGGLSSVMVMHVTDGYFATMGIPVLAGREFGTGDGTERALVILANQAFLKRYFPAETPVTAVGKRLVAAKVEVEIIGIVGDVRQTAVTEPAEPTLYISYFQNPRVKVDLVARTTLAPEVMMQRVRQAIWSIDKNQPITAMFPLADAVSDALARPRLLTVLLGLFGIIGLTLGGLGLFGVLAYLVAQRRREIGVRLALGASATAVLRMIVGRGLALAAMGIAAGLAAALALTRFMRGVLYGVESWDPLTFAGVAVGLLGIAALASAVPARRAIRIDPATTLRND